METSLQDTDVTTPAGDSVGKDGNDPLGRGMRLGRYLVLTRLGSGAMGVVYAAYDPELDRKVALKLLHSTRRDGADEERRASLIREAQALARLSHPNVVTVHDVGTIDHQVWIAMEFVPGQTLRQWAEQRPRSWAEVLDVMQQAGRGLGAAHSADLLHRDFKPDNAMIDPDGRVRVMDFGLAARPHRETTGTRDTTEGLDLDMRSELASLALRSDGDGRVRGTPAYMSPEQLAQSETDARSDQFAFCVSLWELLHAQRPFSGETMMALVAAVLNHDITPPPRSSKVPAWLRRICQRGLSRERDDRFENMDALLEALERGRARARHRWLALGLVGVLAASAGAFGLRQHQRLEREAQCVAAGAAIDEVWNDARRDEVRVHLLATEASFAGTTAHKVMPWIDQQASGWRDAQTEACRNNIVESIWDDELLDRSRWCLTHRRDELNSLVTALLDVDRTSIRHAIPAVFGLDRVSECIDASTLRRLPPPPAVELRDSSLELQRELLHAAAALGQEKQQASIPTIERLRERARSSGWPPLLAMALSLESRLLARLGRYDDAERIGVSAYIEAGRAQDWHTAAVVAEELVVLVGFRQARITEGLQWAHHGEMAASLAGDPNGLREASRLIATGIADRRVDRTEQTRQDIERGLAIRRRVLGDDHPETARAYNALGMTLARVGRWTEAQEHYIRSHELIVQVYGEDHPRVAVALNNLCISERKTGAHDAARTHCNRALALWEAAFDADHPSIAIGLTNLADVLRASDQLAEAQGLHQRARDIRERTLGTDHPYYAQSLSKLGELLLVRGELEPALAQLEAAMAIYETHADVQDNERSAAFWLAQALVRSGGDRERAVALVREAHRTFVAPSMGEIVDRQEIETWLREHDAPEPAVDPNP